MKPSPLIFNLALRMAGLDKCHVWYAGNSIKCDVFGANSAGLFPVWYNAVNEVLGVEYKDIDILK